MVVCSFPTKPISETPQAGLGISGRKILRNSLAALIALGLAGTATNLLDSGEPHQNSKPGLEERLGGSNRPATIGSANYFDEISQMRFESIEDIPKLIKYTNRSTFRVPQNYRTVHQAYERAVEAAAKLNDKPMQYLALLYQSSILRRAETNIVLPKEESHTSLFGTLKSTAKLNFNFRFYNLAKAYEKYEKAQKIWVEAGGLPINVGYGLNKWGDVPAIDEVCAKMIQTMDEMVLLIGGSPEPRYRSKIPLLVSQRESLLATLPEKSRKKLSISQLSPNLQYTYGGLRR